MKQGGNRLELMLGDGWYKGNFGLRQRYENYGDRLAAIAEIHIWYEDGTKEVVGTDESWKARRSHVVESGIYNGEVYDATQDVSRSSWRTDHRLGAMSGCHRGCPRPS